MEILRKNKKEWQSTASVTLLIEHHSMHQKVTGLIPGQGTCPSKGHEGGSQSMFLSLTPSLFLPMKSIKNTHNTPCIFLKW